MDRDVRTIETPKGKVEFAVKGTGRPLLVLHGSLQNCNNRMGYDALLKAGFSIITPSRPGYGYTPAASGRTAEEAADLCAALLDSLRIEKVHVMASSYGGPTGLWFASKYPDRVGKLVLASAVAKPIDDPKRLESARKFYGKGHKAMWKMLGFVGAVSRMSLVRQTYVLFSTCDPTQIMKKIGRQDIDEIVSFYRKKPENKGALLDLDHAIPGEILDRIAVPTLIVHSKEDKAVPFEQAEYAHARIKDSELFVANTWGHFVFIGKGSEDVLNKIIGFIS